MITPNNSPGCLFWLEHRASNNPLKVSELFTSVAYEHMLICLNWNTCQGKDSSITKVNIWHYYAFLLNQKTRIDGNRKKEQLEKPGFKKAYLMAADTIWTINPTCSHSMTLWFHLDCSLPLFSFACAFIDLSSLMMHIIYNCKLDVLNRCLTFV